MGTRARPDVVLWVPVVNKPITSHKLLESKVDSLNQRRRFFLALQERQERVREG
jgi:hypothetical protein